ncbi:helix-turn-helix domain-containing protein, partial [Corynebacterium sp.]|uniref:helix-turn-helix domain-containing protein n=1 Tax=Corynebacterium sp. TaxID=1720 RepID=UPI0034C5EC16
MGNTFPERETQNCEFKETVSDTFLKTVSAFANHEGGRIFFGVADSGKTVGINHP